jgi:hypothetical protein
MVFVPTEPGEISIGRAIFYIADDGVLEQSSSSVAPSVYRRFRAVLPGAAGFGECLTRLFPPRTEFP